MNLQQLEYIVAVDTVRHFEKAAAKCFVTQATLSMMIKKLEQELDIIIFDRSKQPVVPTETGKQIIEQARIILKETQQLKAITKEVKQGTSGELRIGVIPTIAPYLLPLYLTNFLKKYPAIKLKIVEQTTEHLLKLLSSDKLDVAIMATPLSEKALLKLICFTRNLKCTYRKAIRA